ncbi:MAG TPA: hypothetical protein VL092_00625 [Chitinophagaceae bacterium]|nr:hypothetical protein [Chitinophagaceae bacterium]
MTQHKTGITKLQFYCLFIFFGLLSGSVAAQTYLETFGQNRLQLRTFAWKVFETDHFRIYHYDRAGKDLARYVAEQAENDIAAVEKTTGVKVKDKFHIIVYNSYDEYRQTNIGRQNDATQIRSTESGTVDMADDKLVVYFTGVHTELRDQLRNGISEVFLEQKIKGGNGGSKIVNAAKINIPQWVQDGYVAYTSKGWDEQTDKAWKGLIEGSPRKKFYAFTDINGTLTGKAFWKYIAERHGKKEVKELLSSMKSKGNMNKALKARYQLNVLKVFDSCLTYFKEAYALDAADKQTRNTDNAIVKIKVPTDNSIIRNILVSPRGADVAYVKWKEGEFKVCLKHTVGEQAESVILEGGEKNYMETADPNYPLMTWSNTGYKLAILYKKGNGMRLRIYDATRGKVMTYVIPNNRFDRALGMAIDEDNNGIFLSAIRKSQTDLYYFAIKGSRMRNLTNDRWDDVQPSFVTGGRKRGIVFLSNRPRANMNVPTEVNELPTGPMNAFFYDTKTQSPALLRCSDADQYTKISQPIQFGTDNFAYLSDVNGVRNKYVVVFGRNQYNQDSAYWVPATNLAHSINSHQYNPAGNLVTEVIRQDGYYCAYIDSLLIPGIDVPVSPVTPSLLVEKESNKVGLSPNEEPQSKRNISTRRSLSESRKMSGITLEGGNIFQSEFGSGTAENTTESNADTAATAAAAPEEELIIVPAADSTFMKMKAQPYRHGFKASDFSISLDNNLLFNRYQSASQNGNQFANPSLGGLVTISIDDLMENYRFVGGFKLPFGAPGSTYFFQFENAKRRLDWNVALLRNTNSQPYSLNFTDSSGNTLFSTIGLGKTVTNLVQGTASYPLDRMRSVRFQLGVRQDLLNFKAIDTFTLIFPSSRKYWTMSRVEYIFDNSKLITTNIRNGLRYKVFAEYMLQMNDKGGAVYNFGFDARNYFKIYKNLIWAFRLAGAHSGGKQKILYFMGGVDNWLNYQNATPQTPVGQETFGFQTVSNNLRGYRQNARNGNSYALANSEFRFPILTGLIRRPIQSKLLRSIQLVAFTDAGMAWNGLFPTDKNMSKTLTLSQQPVSVTINYPSESLSIGYGMGMRMALSGYQFRIDAAWNKNGSPKPILYLSLGTDF